MQLTSALGHLQPKPSYHQKFFFGSVSEHNTLNTPGSGDEWKAELICRLISGMIIYQLGHERSLTVIHSWTIL